MKVLLSTEVAYSVTVYLTLISTAYTALELSFIPKHYLSFVYPEVVSLKPRTFKWIRLHVLQIVFSFVASIAFFLKSILVFKSVFALVVLTTLYSYVNRRVGKDGADQVRMLALMSISFCFLLDMSTGQSVVLGFMGLQILLGYTTSGLAKLSSPQWRSGRVLHLIFGTYSYGMPRAADFFENHPLLEKTFTYSAILLMLFVPVSLLISNPYVLFTSLISILIFHLSTAIIMGLNDFVIAFPIGYPGLIQLHGWIHNYTAL